MGKPDTLWQAQAAEAAARIDAARAAGEQLALPMGDEAGRAGDAQGEARRARGAGKATSQLREWAAARGLRMPEDVLAELAGMTTRDDVFTAAMARTEQVLLWAGGEHGRATMAMRLDLFKVVFTGMIRSAEALLPYGLAKVTPDASTVVVPVVLAGGQSPAAAQGAPGVGPDRARDVTPGARRLAPPPMPGETMENQQVAQPARTGSDAGIRTQEASR